MSDRKDKIKIKAKEIRARWEKEPSSCIISHQLCNLLALYLDQNEVPTSIGSEHEYSNGIFFFIVKTELKIVDTEHYRYRTIKIRQDYNLNNLSYDNMEEKPLDELLKIIQAVKIEVLNS